MKRGFVELKGARFLLQGPRFPYRAIGSPYIVGHSSGFNCTGPRGASKKIGLGQIKNSSVPLNRPLAEMLP